MSPTDGRVADQSEGERVGDLGPTDDAHGDAGPSAPIVTLPASCGRPAWPAAFTSIHVTPGQAAQLPDIIAGATSDTEILLGNGTYVLASPLRLARPRLILRSATGQRDAVVLDGQNLSAGSAVVEVRASDIVLADLSVLESGGWGILVEGSAAGPTERTLLYNLVLKDNLATQVLVRAGNGHFCDEGTVACSHFELTDAFRARTQKACKGVGGLGLAQAADWLVVDNRFVEFWCDGVLASGTISAFRGSRDTVVARNSFINPALGIRFGVDLPSPLSVGRQHADSPCAPLYHDHVGGVACSNVIYADRAVMDSGILMWNACRPWALNNTVFSEQTSSLTSSIEWRYSITQVTVINNLVNYHLLAREGATAGQGGNVTTATSELFVDPAGSDLHLVATASVAIDQGDALPLEIPPACALDIDGAPRDDTPDVGADERP